MSIFIKKKKFIFLITLIVVGKAVAAEPFPAGVYVGLGGGYNKTNSRFSDIGGTITGNLPFTISGQKKDLSTFALTGFLGYLHIIKPYSLTFGGELFWTFHKGEKDFNAHQPIAAVGTSTINSNFSQKYEYGFKFLFGYLIDNLNHVYGLLGVSRKKFRENAVLKNSNYVAEEFTIDSYTTRDFSKSYLLLGIGYERAANKIRYGVEGTYQIGNKEVGVNNRASVPADPATIITTNYTRKVEHSYAVLFKISYNFDIFN